MFEALLNITFCICLALIVAGIAMFVQMVVLLWSKDENKKQKRADKLEETYKAFTNVETLLRFLGVGLIVVCLLRWNTWKGLAICLAVYMILEIAKARKKVRENERN